jgi:hypothetical protein
MHFVSESDNNKGIEGKLTSEIHALYGAKWFMLHYNRKRFTVASRCRRASLEMMKILAIV